MELFNVIYTACSTRRHHNTLSGKLDLDFHSRADGILITVTKTGTPIWVTYRLREIDIAKLSYYFDEWLRQHTYKPKGGKS